MRDPRLKKLSDGLLDHSVKVEPNEHVLIEVFGDGMPLAKELIKGVYARNVFPFLKVA